VCKNNIRVGYLSMKGGDAGIGERI